MRSLSAGRNAFFVRILVTVSPRMYREAIALSIRSRRPDFEGLIAPPRPPARARRAPRRAARAPGGARSPHPQPSPGLRGADRPPLAPRRAGRALRPARAGARRRRGGPAARAAGGRRARRGEGGGAGLPPAVAGGGVACRVRVLVADRVHATIEMDGAVSEARDAYLEDLFGALEEAEGLSLGDGGG